MDICNQETEKALKKINNAMCELTKLGIRICSMSYHEDVVRPFVEVNSCDATDRLISRKKACRIREGHDDVGIYTRYGMMMRGVLVRWKKYQE